MTAIDPDGRRDQIHLPGQSLLPLGAAAGLTIGAVGFILSWWFVALGGLILLIAVVRWVQAVREEVDTLPR